MRMKTTIKLKKTCISRLLSVLFILFVLLDGYLVHAFARDPLPIQIKIYVNQQGNLLVRPAEGYDPKLLPVTNISLKNPGCYIACHSTNPDKGVYAISAKIYVIGLIRIEGQYQGQSCQPRNYEQAEIRDEVIFQEICSKTYQCIGNSCWAGGNTGALFGLK